MWKGVNAENENTIVHHTTQTTRKSNNDERQRKLLGGFSSVNDTKNKEYEAAIQLVYDQLKTGQEGVPIVSYASSLIGTILDDEVRAVPIEISQQVVAGLNLRMKLGFFKTTKNRKKKEKKSDKDSSSMNTTLLEMENCIGGISVLVFRNLKGEYNVEKWGDELSCDQVIALLNQNEGDE